MVKQRNNRKRLKKSAKTHALICKGVAEVIAAVNLIHGGSVSDHSELITKTSTHTSGKVKQLNTDGTIIMNKDNLGGVVHERVKYCLFFSMVNSLVGKVEHQRALSAGREHSDIAEAVIFWRDRADRYVEQLALKLKAKGEVLGNVERDDIGYRAIDAREYLWHLRRMNFIKDFVYTRILQDDPRGVDFAILARFERRELKNKRIILHGITANLDWVNEIAGGLLRTNGSKKKKKKAIVPKKTQVEIEAGYIESMKLFHPRIEKCSEVKNWKKLRAAGKFKESEDEYPFSAHAICVVFDAGGNGWIGNPAKHSWKALNFRNYVENMIWTDFAYEFDIVL